MYRSLQITLNDIAKQLNVSTVTVSKALRDHPDISAKTKKQVKDLAQQLGYTPNYAARSLSSKRSNTIGLVVPKISNNFYPLVIQSIYDATYLKNYETLLTISYEDPQREQHHLESLLSMRVDGILLSITQKTTDLKIFSKIKKMGIPLVFFDRTIEGIGFSSVKVNDRQAAYVAVEHAIEKGYKKIAHLAGFSHIDVGRLRLEGFLEAMQEHHIPIEPGWVIECGFNKENGYDAFRKIYQSGKLPEIIFTAGFSVALGVYTAATEVGIKIPDDIDLIFIGDGQVNRFASRSLACVSQPVEEIGIKSVELLIDEIQNPKSVSPQVVVLETGLKIQ